VPETTTSIGPRLYYLQHGLDLFMQKPWWGWGTGAYHGEFCQHFTAPGYCEVVCPHPHNQFLFFQFEQGAIGLLLFLWFVFALIREAWRHEARHQAFTLAFVVTLCVASLTHSAFWLSTESHCLILMSALIMAGLRARRTVGGQT